jgi:hypothetical protein
MALLINAKLPMLSQVEDVHNLSILYHTVSIHIFIPQPSTNRLFQLAQLFRLRREHELHIRGQCCFWYAYGLSMAIFFMINVQLLLGILEGFAHTRSFMIKFAYRMLL